MGRSGDSCVVRRLTIADEPLLREAFTWDVERPSWYRQADAVFNIGNADDLLSLLTTRWFVGIFNPELEAVVIVEWRGEGQFEGHLMARRGADVQMIVNTITYLLHDLLDYGLVEAFCWVAEKNRSVRNLCSTIGFRPDGIVMYRGTYRGRLIKWLRYSVQREELAIEYAA